MDESTKTVLWIVGIIVGIAAVVGIASNSNSSAKTTYTNSYTTPSYTTPKYTEPTKTVETKTTTITWHCIDATSYNKNPYDDNYCVSSDGQSRYVSDSQARALDPSYIPGTFGHPYYNSK